MSDDQTKSIPTGVESQALSLKVGMQPLRVWPAAMLLAGMVIARLLPRLVENGPANLWMSAAIGPGAGGILIVLWWLLLSRLMVGTTRGDCRDCWHRGGHVRGS